MKRGALITVAVLVALGILLSSRPAQPVTPSTTTVPVQMVVTEAAYHQFLLAFFAKPERKPACSESS